MLNVLSFQIQEPNLWTQTAWCHVLLRSLHKPQFRKVMGAVGAPSPPPAPTICLHCLPHHTALKTAIRQKGSNWVCLGNDFCPCPRDAHSTTRLSRQAEMDVPAREMPSNCHLRAICSSCRPIYRIWFSAACKGLPHHARMTGTGGSTKW